MSALIVIITESDVLARALDRTLSITLGQHVETCFMTYQHSRLSGQLLRQADLFILEVLARDTLGYRVAGIDAAKKFATTGKKSLLISDRCKAEKIGSLYYWDAASPDHLPERVLKVLTLPPPDQEAFVALQKGFAVWCRPPHDGHH
jgi:hypothetical protein